MRNFLFLFFLIAFASPALAGIAQRDVVRLLTEEAKLRYQTPEVEVEWKAPSLEVLMGGRVPEDARVVVPPSTRLMGDGAVPLQVYRGDTLVRTLYPRVDVKVYGFALAAKSRISKGDPLDGNNLEVQRKHLKDLPTQPLTKLDALAGSRAKRDIPAGTVLTSGLIDLPSLVKSGSMVTVQVVSGDLTILSSGQALSDGQAGQLIKIRNPASRREFSGRVLGEGLVEVRLED